MYSQGACKVKTIWGYGSMGTDQMQRRQANAEMQMQRSTVHVDRKAQDCMILRCAHNLEKQLGICKCK